MKTIEIRSKTDAHGRLKVDYQLNKPGKSVRVLIVIIIAFISSKLTQNILKTDVVVGKGNLGWNESGLIVDSVIKLHKIVTIPKTLVKRRLGTINKQLQVEVREKLAILFDLFPRFG